MSIRKSCGFIILHKHSNTFLLGKVTNYKEYSIPKGGIEENETPLQCAFRECREECGVEESFLKKHPIYELGTFRYPNGLKTLTCFLCVVDEKPSNLRCDSTFTDSNGRQLPEMSGFVWADVDNFQYPIHQTQKQALEKALLILNKK